MAKQIYLVVFLISFSGISRGENYLKKEQHNFVVRDMNGFVEEVLFYGFSENDDILPIYFNSLYRISDITLYTSTDDITWEKQKTKNAVVEDVNTSTFYDGYKKYNIIISEKHFYKLSYTKSIKEIKKLSSLSIRNEIKTDSIINTIHLEAPLVFSYLNPSADSTFRFYADSSLSGSEKVYRFVSVNDKRDADTYKCDKKIYCTVHLPGNSPEMELNSWLKNLYKTTDGINQQTTDEINKITVNLKDSLEITQNIFEYVKHKIDYIDIEAGYGAWCPRRADDILTAHKGDCKDMANLVYQMLKYKKIRCYMAIMPTLSHPDDFLFPSMASANHAICVAYVKNNWYFLDATDSHNFFDLPSRHTQGRTVFCVTDSVPFLMKIPVVSPEKNKTTNTMNINISDTAITGSWDIAFNGHRAVQILDLIKSYAKEDIQEGINNYFKNKVPKLKIISTSYEIAENGLVKLHADFFSPVSMVANSDNLHYISLNYLPKPSSNSLMESGCHHFMFSTIADTYHITYHFTKPVKIENTINVKSGEEQMQFEMKLQQSNEREVTLQYTFQNPYLEYDEQLYEKQQAFMTRINKNYNNQIIYE